MIEPVCPKCGAVGAHNTEACETKAANILMPPAGVSDECVARGYHGFSATTGRCRGCGIRRDHDDREFSSAGAVKAADFPCSLCKANPGDKCTDLAGRIGGVGGEDGYARYLPYYHAPRIDAAFERLAVNIETTALALLRLTVAVEKMAAALAGTKP